MKQIRLWGKALLWLHLFVCCIWLVFFFSLFHDRPIEMPDWMGHVVIWSALGVQVTWGLTIGVLVGPSRKRRDMLWWSLLTIPYPFWWASQFVRLIDHAFGPGIAGLYMSLFAVILACETYGGVLLGAKLHAEANKED